MLVYKKGDLFSSAMPALAHGVNTEGSMGKGIALSFRTFFPEIMAPYKNQCKSGELSVGKMQALKTHSGKWVLNCASQKSYRAPARLEWIEASLNKACEFCVQNNLKGFAMPVIGCGLGALQWEEVAPLVEKLVQQYSIEVEVWTL